jgi:iron complex outermembrane receptor protein
LVANTGCHLNRQQLHFAQESPMPNHRPFPASKIAHAVALIGTSLAVGALHAQTADTSDVPRAKDDNVRIGTIVISGQGDKLGAGQMLKEDATKARSTVTRAATEKDRATGNSYQAMALLPGVNTFNHDATGLFGGTISVRGFTADQMGVTINGVPVNDSGSYSVFPQEYSDQENLCTQTLAPGAPDVESPHIGSSGGSLGINSCDPEDKFRTRLSQTLGGLHLSRSFVRVDSGRFANNMAKVFLSYSHSRADKWKGEGKAERDHIDAAFSFDPNPDIKIVGSVLYNKAVNHNIGNLSLAQLNALGYYYDFSTTFPGHTTPVGGTAQVDTAPSPQYYKLSINPFENAIVSLSGSFALTQNTLLKVQPYYWYGYGTGGNQQRLQRENQFLNTTTNTVNAGVDLNGDGDTLDSVIVANSSVTRTNRPGVTAEINHSVGNHVLKLGLWYERAEHRQTGPAVLVDNSGEFDQWLRNDRILRPDGTQFQSRDWLTISPAYQLYAADTFSFDQDKGALTVGLRAPHITRTFTNNPSEAGGASLNAYTFEKSFSKVLPQIGVRYSLAKEHQLFANIGKNFRAPPNFAFAPTNGNITVTGGVPVLTTPIEGESAVATDLGYRYQGREVTASVTLFKVDFSDRQANAYDPTNLRSVYTNAGKTTKSGVEFEAGTAVFGGFTAYLSATVQDDKMKSDLLIANGQLLPTNGKTYTLVPKYMAGTSLQYSKGGFYGRVKAKYTGKQFATLVNDEEVPAYTTVDLDAGYKIGDLGMVKNALVRFNVSNVFNERYRNPSSGSVTNAQPIVYSTTSTRAAQTVFYYLGAPRLFTVTLSADFQ